MKLFCNRQETTQSIDPLPHHVVIRLMNAHHVEKAHRRLRADGQYVWQRGKAQCHDARNRQEDPREEVGICLEGKYLTGRV